MRISGVYAHMGIRRSKQLVLTEVRAAFRSLSSEWFNFHLYFGVFSDSECTRIVVYMQSFGISLWYGLVWQVDLCLYVKITV